MALVGGIANEFQLPQDLWREILDHVLACLPEEACGLVGSAQNPVLRSAPAGCAVGAARSLTAAVVLPIENELHNPDRFRMAPAAQLKAFYWLDERGLDLAAIFHSHPHGPSHPSETDLAEFAYPGVLMLIVSPLEPLFAGVEMAVSEANWQVRAYRIDAGLSSGLTASEVPLLLVARP